MVPRPPKIKFLKNEKKTAPGLYLRNKCTKFQPNPTILGLCRLPQSFRTDRQTLPDSSSTEVEKTSIYQGDIEINFTTFYCSSELFLCIIYLFIIYNIYLSTHPDAKCFQ